MACVRFAREFAVRCSLYVPTLKQARFVSTGSTYISVTQDDQLPGVAIMTMDRKPVNGMNLDFLTQANDALDKLESSKENRGVIVTSKVPKIFSAGLDIKEMYQPDPERLRFFWRTLQDFFMKLYGSSLVTAAAINGTSPAGGCLTALCCDMRIFADEPKYRIGLNEAQLGIMIPKWLEESYILTIGIHEASRACQTGQLFSPQEATKVKLVDALVPSDEVMDKTREEMKKWLKIPEHARQLIKQDFKRPLLDKMIATREDDINSTVAFLTQDSVQKSMGNYLAALQSKSQK